MDYDLEKLEGQYVRLWPYSRGYYPRDTLYHLWRLVEEDNAAPSLFHSQLCPIPTVPYEWRGDLVEFVKVFESESRILLIAQSVQKDEIAGFFWFDDVVSKFRASCNIFYRRRYWGHPAREASRLAIGYGFEFLEFKSVWAYTPWDHAAKHAEAVGFHPLISLPEMFQSQNSDGKLYPLHILRLTRQEWDHGIR